MKIFCKWFGHKYTKKKTHCTGGGDLYQHYQYIERICIRCSLKFFRVAAKDYSDMGNTQGIKERFELAGKTISDTGYKMVDEPEFEAFQKDYKSEDVNFNYQHCESQAVKENVKT